MFGDIVDTFWPAVEGPDVDSCNHLGSDDDVEDAIVCVRWSERDKLAAEGFWDFDGAAEEADVTALLDPALGLSLRDATGADRRFLQGLF